MPDTRRQIMDTTITEIVEEETGFMQQSHPKALRQCFSGGPVGAASGQRRCGEGDTGP